MKIGLYLGSFDPIHIGHVAVINAINNSGLCDYVRVIPAWRNVWKKTTTSFDSRCDMIHNELESLSSTIGVSTVEKIVAEMEGITDKQGIPTFKVIDFLNGFSISSSGKSIEFIIFTTKETLSEIPKWERAEVILKNKIMTVGSELDCDIYVPKIEICSTFIREVIRAGKDPYPFISKKNYDYIRTHGLYG